MLNTTDIAQRLGARRTQFKLLRRALLSAVLALCAAGAGAASLAGRVIGIADGDTITVLDAQNTAHRVRLQGIDAPEKGQSFGNVSREHLAKLVFQRNVELDYNKRDRYGRLVATVLLAGVDVNLKQIEAGLAWHFKKYEGEQAPEERERYAQAEDKVRAARLGLWREVAPPVAPWEFREQRLARSR